MSLPIEEQKKLILAEAKELLLNRQCEMNSESDMSKTSSVEYQDNSNIDNFYSRYIEILDNYLISKGINCEKITFNHSSCEVHSIQDDKINTIDSIYELECRGMIFLFPENGYLLWRKGEISPENTQWYESIYSKLMAKEWFSESRDYLAVLATESELYALMQSGMVKSTDPNFKEEYIIKKVDEARRICLNLPIDKVLEKAALVNHIYSWNCKCFIHTYTDGSYDTGLYEITDFVSKNYILDCHIVDIRLYDMWHDVVNGIVPDFAAYDCLPEDTTVVNHRYSSTLIY